MAACHCLLPVSLSSDSPVHLQLYKTFLLLKKKVQRVDRPYHMMSNTNFSKMGKLRIKKEVEGDRLDSRDTYVPPMME